MSTPPRPFGLGPLSRAANAVYWVLVVELLLLLTAAPGLVLVVLLERDPSNIPLVALATLPLAPALAAAVFAWRVFLREGDPNPARHFWRGYWMNALDAVRAWLPGLVVLTVVAVNLAHRDVLGLPLVVVLVQVAVALAVLVWMVALLVVTALFSFRWLDAARITVRCLRARPAGALGVLSVVVLSAGVVLYLSDWVLWLLGSLMALWLLRSTAPVVDEVERSYLA